MSPLLAPVMMLLRSLFHLRKLVLYVVGFLLTMLILRTPTAPYYNPGIPRPPEPNNKAPRSRLPQDLQDFLQWDPPQDDPDHYPPYAAYKDRDYDPNRWEIFHQNTGIYLNGTFKKLETAQPPKAFLPYPKYESNDYQSKWKGQYAPCDGPNDKPISSDSDQVITAYQAVPNGFPYPDVGSWEAVGLDGSVCFDRNSRLGPYGLDKSKSKVDFTKVKWGALQNKCLTKNRSRFEKADAPTLKTGIGTPDFDDRASKNTAKRELEPRANTPFKARNAVLIRTWDNYQYQENDLQAIRSLVSELSLQSGAEYHVFLFVNIKDTDTPIFSDGKAYNEALEKYVPAEFRDMAILWTEDVCQQWYSKIGEWSVYWQQFMPLQWFSRTHPEFDYVWNWEMDARYIGQHYDFMEKISSFAKKQPRKFIWERNSRYYIPAQHGDWANFTSETNRIVQQAKGAHQMHTVWGPEPWAEEQTEHIMGSQPPRNEDQDNFEWGVDEEADFITLLPLWDPRETWWSYRDKLFNYPGSEQATEERPYPHVPRRVFINTFVRFSTKLLDAMHYENSAGLSMASEMWPGTIALQHGFKAVYAPHPIWQSHVWPADFMEITFNADGWGAGSKPGHNIDDGRGVMWDQERQNRGEEQAGTGPNKEGKLGRWGQERDSPYNPDREHNFAGWSWYFWSDFPRIIYWRWLGWKAGFSIVTIGGRKVTDELGLAGGADWENDNGRMCLPSMLLHPVKDVKPPDM